MITYARCDGSLSTLYAPPTYQWVVLPEPRRPRGRPKAPPKPNPLRALCPECRESWAADVIRVYGDRTLCPHCAAGTPPVPPPMGECAACRDWLPTESLTDGRCGPCRSRHERQMRRCLWCDQEQPIAAYRRPDGTVSRICRGCAAAAREA